MIDQDCSMLRRAGVEPASKVPVYTGSSGLSQPVGGAEYPGHGASGSLDQQEQQEQQQEQEQAAPPLTDTIAMGLQSMEDCRLQIHAIASRLSPANLPASAALHLLHCSPQASRTPALAPVFLEQLCWAQQMAQHILHVCLAKHPCCASNSPMLHVRLRCCSPD